MTIPAISAEDAGFSQLREIAEGITGNGFAL
jgi:hypothetical protein